jgi:pSer/pThr/pTyr-binding forkhead associated (FHA) protein
MDVNLVLFKKNGTMKNFILPSTVTVVGRRQDCDLCIPLMVVSRRHCELNQDQSLLKVRDLGSRNGTFVNDRRIDEADLHAGDRIHIGPLTFGVQIDGAPTEFEPADAAAPPLPEHIAKTDKQLDDEDDIFQNMDDIDLAQGPNASETLENLSDEINGNDNLSI